MLLFHSTHLHKTLPFPAQPHISLPFSVLQHVLVAWGRKTEESYGGLYTGNYGETKETIKK